METEVKQEEGKWKIRHDTSWKIKIPRALYDKIFMYTKVMDKEIAGFGDVEVDDTNKVYRITKLMMFKQKVTGSTTDQDEKALGDMISDALSNGTDLSKTKFEWHSHVNMNVFWSSTDEECCKTLVNCSQDFYLFFVVNKKGELLSRVDYLVPFSGGRLQLTHLQIPVFIEEPVDNGLEEEVKKDIAKYIEEPVTTHHSYGGHDSDAWKNRPYREENMCQKCQSSVRPARWDFDAKGYLCKECEEEKDKNADTDIAICPYCQQVCVGDFSMLRSEKVWRCDSCNTVVVPTFIEPAKEEKDKTLLGECWAKCEDCQQDGYVNYVQAKDQWLCVMCQDKFKRSTRRGGEYTSFEDSDGKRWFWAKCECCDMKEPEYVTWVAGEQKRMCDECLTKHNEKTGKVEGK